MSDLLFSRYAPASTSLVFGESDTQTIPTVSATVAGGLPAPTLQALLAAPVEARLAGVLPNPTLIAAFKPIAAVKLIGTLPAPTFQAILIPPTRAYLTGTLPAPTLTALMAQVVGVRVIGTLPGLQMVAEARYSSKTSRPTVGQTFSAWQVANKPDQTGIGMGQQGARKSPVGWDSFWQKATGATEIVEHQLPSAFAPHPVDVDGAYRSAQIAHCASDFRHQDADRTLRELLNTAFEKSSLLRDSTHFRHQDGDRTKRSSRLSRMQGAQSLSRVQGSSFQPAIAFQLGLDGRYQEAVPPPPGISLRVIPQPPGPGPCYDPNGHLVFALPAAMNGNLLFRCGDYAPVQEPVTVPIQRVYIVLNNTALRRLSDNAVVPCTSMSLSLDVTSWTWGFDASIPGNYQALVEPTSDGPVALAAWVNGTEFRVLAESISRERSFGKVGLRVSGRGINAELDAPYAPIQTFRNTELRTSAQLLEDVLTVNGVPMGYAFDYAPAAWEVPAGAFNHQGTYIGALAAIAQASGGFLLPHTRDRAFSVQQLYPIAPWEWGAAVPDFVLPSAVVTKEGAQWKEMPSYNRVFVSGQDNGVLGQVTRAGTDGTVLAPMVVDALITSATAARQRGLSVLGNTGRQLMHSLRLPVLAETGVIQPGALVQYEDGDDMRVGMVRSTSVEVGYPDVYQTIGVECHA